MSQTTSLAARLPGYQRKTVLNSAEGTSASNISYQSWIIFARCLAGWLGGANENIKLSQNKVAGRPSRWAIGDLGHQERERDRERWGAQLRATKNNNHSFPGSSVPVGPGLDPPFPAWGPNLKMRKREKFHLDD